MAGFLFADSEQAGLTKEIGLSGHLMKAQLLLQFCKQVVARAFLAALALTFLKFLTAFGFTPFGGTKGL